MKIAILTLGTRGDVQPYAVLGQALQQRGHQVTLATAKNFESLVRSYGIGFAPVEADYQAILQTEEGKRIMKGNPLAIRRNLEKWIYPLIRDSLSDFHALAQDSDRVLYHVKTLADSFADQFPEKMIRAMVVPAVQPTSAFANPAFSGLPIPSFLNRFSYKLTDWGP
jgi:sterol 3beta-glucosyltransferase